MKIIMASDHAGRRLRKRVREHLEARALEIRDLGVADDVSRADYPDYALAVAGELAAGNYDFGILVCGTGLGMAMAANRVPGARASNCVNEFQARLARAHNNANILTLGERVLGEELACVIVDIFLATPFEGGRHQQRLDKF